MPSRTYQVTPERFTSLMAGLTGEGFTLFGQSKDATPSTGTASGHGVIMNYSYDNASALNLTGISKPWIVSWDYVFSQLDPYLA